MNKIFYSIILFGQKQQAHGKRTSTAHGRKYVEDNLEGTLDLPEVYPDIS